eukprot:scaffold34592_cov63-Phaeocystis_antarctica.AAC.4
MHGSISYDSVSHHVASPPPCSGAPPTAMVTRAQPARHASPRTPTHGPALPGAVLLLAAANVVVACRSSQKASCRSV